MSFNPFAPEPTAGYYQQPQAAAPINPFLADVSVSYQSQMPPATQAPIEINPFLSYAPPPVAAPVSTAYNPFASFAPEPQIASTAPIYVSTANTANQWGFPQESYANQHEEQRRSSTVPDFTQNLLQSVTGALEATSDSLSRIGQPSPIPPYSTPSPRSPSPDLLGLGDYDQPQQQPPPLPQSAPPQQYVPTSTYGSSKASIDIMSLYSQAPAVQQQHQQYQQQQQSSNVGFDLISGLEDVDFAQASVPAPMPEPAPTPAFIPNEVVNEPKEEVIMSPENVMDQGVQEDQKQEEAIQSPKQITPSIQEPQKQIEAEEPLPPPAPAPLVQPVVIPKAKPPERPKPPPVPPAPVPIKKESPPARPDPPPVPAQPPAHIPAQPPPPPAARSPVPPPPEIVPMEQQSPPFQPPVVTERPEPPPPPVARFEQPAIFTPVPATEFPSAAFSRPPPPPVAPRSPYQEEIKPPIQTVAFDSFEDRFNRLDDVPSSTVQADAFGSGAGSGGGGGAWGDEGTIPLQFGSDAGGFGNDDQFDSFLSLTEPPPVPQSTPAKGKFEDDERTGISITIRSKDYRSNELSLELAPALAPPPKSPAALSTGSAFSEPDNNGFVPFLSSVKEANKDSSRRSDSQDSPQTPLFEEDQTQPLEDFPRIKYSCDGWEMHMRHPNKKKITGQRFWKKVYVRLVNVNDTTPTVQIFNTAKDKDPFQEIPLQPCYSVSDVAAQQFDQYGKIFTVKLQYIFYKERPGVRPGQISKAEKLTTRLTQFAAYAIQGDYQGVKEFGSDLKKLGLPLEHAPQVSQLVKLGTQNFEEMKQFSVLIEEALFRLPVHRDRSLQYKSEEVQVTMVDEYYVEQDIYGVVTRQIARVRLHLLSFLSGEAEIELGINDIRRQGLEVVGRHDIIPIATEEWIRIEDIEFSSCVKLDVFEKTKMVKFKPPDACYIELLRFRVRPPRHRELPLQVKTTFTNIGNRVDIRCDILVPGFTSRKLGQIPCEDVMVRIPIPECWIYMFRVEKHFRYGSVKSAHRRSGKVKGIERFLGAVEAVEQSLMEVTSGQAKYEHQHKSIVWRVPRLPKEGQGAYTTHSFFCHITLQPHEEMPANLTKHCYVEFTMPHTTISHTVCRSISVPHCDEPPEKCVKYLSRHEYVVEIEHTQGVTPATYNLAATVKPSAISEQPESIPEQPVKMEGAAESDSDFSE